MPRAPVVTQVEFCAETPATRLQPCVDFDICGNYDVAAGVEFTSLAAPTAHLCATGSPRRPPSAHNSGHSFRAPEKRATRMRNFGPHRADQRGRDQANKVADQWDFLLGWPADRPGTVTLNLLFSIFRYRNAICDGRGRLLAQHIVTRGRTLSVGAVFNPSLSRQTGGCK
jgi:hypothetical protein